MLSADGGAAGLSRCAGISLPYGASVCPMRQNAGLSLSYDEEVYNVYLQSETSSFGKL